MYGWTHRFPLYSTGLCPLRFLPEPLPKNKMTCQKLTTHFFASRFLLQSAKKWEYLSPFIWGIEIITEGFPITPYYSKKFLLYSILKALNSMVSKKNLALNSRISMLLDMLFEKGIEFNDFNTLNLWHLFSQNLGWRYFQFLS